MTKTILILGATGGFGGAVAAACEARGWRLRALTRDPRRAASRKDLPGAIEWASGDIMNAADVAHASRGSDVIVHAANPPGYRGWTQLALPMLDNAIAAAQASGARLVFPGNVYNYDPARDAVIDERTRQHPVTRKGTIRVEMERRLETAASAGARCVILRAGDFFGAHAPGSWLSTGIVKPGRAVRDITYPGAHDVGHAWAYLPDLAAAAARLIEIEASLPAFDAFHFDGHYLERGGDFAEVIKTLAGPRARITALPWLAAAAAAPFNTTMREVLEMRYLWRLPLRLDGAKLRAAIGPEPHTPLIEALAASLRGMGCLAPVAADPNPEAGAPTRAGRAGAAAHAV